MKAIIRRLHRGQTGFTLIELLVVVAILGVLAAVAVPNVGRFMQQGRTEAQSAELHNVSTAMMAMMASTNATTVTPVGTATNDMANFPDGTTPLFGAVNSRYINKATTQFWYTVEADGTVSQETTAP